MLLVHPGGPYWTRKDDGAWTIPKGEFDPAQEEALAAAKREFAEETGHTLEVALFELTPVRQNSGKTVHAWAGEGDWDTAQLNSNTFEMEWSKGSGKVRTFPEVDQAAWFDVPTARIKLNRAQALFVDELVKILRITV